MKGLFGLVGKLADKQPGSKQVAKLVGLQQHKALVPLAGKAEVARQSSLYRARKDVKKVLNPGWEPAKKAPGGHIKPPPITHPGTNVPSTHIPPPGSGGLMSFVRQSSDRGGQLGTGKQTAALAKLVGLKEHRSLVPLTGNARVNRQGAIYRANKDVKKLFADVAKQGHVTDANSKAFKSIFDQLKKVDPKAIPSHDEMLKLAHEQGLDTHKLFVKMTGIQVTEQKFNSIKKSHAMIAGKNPHVKAAALTYSGSGYGPINGELRNAGNNQKAGQVAKLSAEIAQQVANIDHAMSKSKFEHDTKLYRGMDNHPSIEFLKTVKPGDVWTDHAYSSTGAFKGFGGTYQLKIHAQKGQQGLVIPSHHGNEKEFLLPRGQRFKVIKRELKKGPYGGENHVIHVQLIKPAPVPVSKPKFDPSGSATPSAAVLKQLAQAAHDEDFDHVSVPGVTHIGSSDPLHWKASAEIWAHEGKSPLVILNSLVDNYDIDVSTAKKMAHEAIDKAYPGVGTASTKAKLPPDNIANITKWAKDKLGAGHPLQEVEDSIVANFDVDTDEAEVIAEAAHQLHKAAMQKDSSAAVKAAVKEFV